jgi:probable H4MPT-linked C1 transfer pathway protein
MPPELTTGWDVGGAHVKVAQVDAMRRVHRVAQAPCTLWLGIAHLERAVAGLRARLAPTRLHAVTMTGELADVFADRAAGVTAIARTMASALGDTNVRVYAGPAGFVRAADAAKRVREIASANWHASARFVAARVTEGLFVDIGSTTTDLVPFAHGEARAVAYSDAERLAAAELAYTGVTRTPVAALARSAPFDGHWQALAAEHFANAADVHRLTGELPSDADQHATADGRGKGADESAGRLARMLGRDANDASLARWRALAEFFAEQQLRQIHDAASRALSRGVIGESAPIVGAGVGRFLVARLAERLGRPYVDFATLIEAATEEREWAARCAPAVAVAAIAAAE